MSNSKDWYPKEDAAVTLFAENYVAEIDPATALAKLPENTFSASKKSAEIYLDLRTQLVVAEREAARLRRLLVGADSRMETDVRAVAKQLRNTINIPEQVLSMLEMNAPTDTTLNRVAAQAPQLSMSTELGVVKGRYVKHGHQGIEVYCCRTGESRFTLLGRFNRNRFEDPRANLTPGQPEQRDYYAVYVDKDQPVGEQSPTVSVVVGSRPG